MNDNEIITAVTLLGALDAEVVDCCPDVACTVCSEVLGVAA